MKFAATINGKTFYKPSGLKKYMVDNLLFSKAAKGSFRGYPVSYELVKRTSLFNKYRERSSLSEYDSYVIYMPRFNRYF